jgi:hypothetical protein
VRISPVKGYPKRKVSDCWKTIGILFEIHPEVEYTDEKKTGLKAGKRMSGHEKLRNILSIVQKSGSTR